jgi:16S rRNA (cytosine1402-N4)-methyltransferase
MTFHVPIMVDEVLEGLGVKPGGIYFDGTVGGGGHTEAVLERSAPDGRVVGLDRDPSAVERCQERLRGYGSRVVLCHADFSEVVETLSGLGLLPVDGLLLDLGVSSHQLDEPGRGFGLMADGPLDMRMDPGAGSTAAELIARLTEEELAGVIRTFGEEGASRRISRAIKRALERGELGGTTDLRRVVTSALGARGGRQQRRIHPATRTFMALRIAVNDELGRLRRFLETFTEALRPGGRVVVLSFHSLEDRAVKERFVSLARPCTCPPDLPVCACGKQPSLALLGRKAVRPRAEEIAANPRARSARLRVAERV